MKHKRREIQTRTYASRSLYGLLRRGCWPLTSRGFSMPLKDIEGVPYPASAWDELVRLGLIEVHGRGTGRIHVKLINRDAVHVYHHVPDYLMGGRQC